MLTHMPFATTYKDKSILLVGHAEENSSPHPSGRDFRAWKIGIKFDISTEEIFRINTGLPEETIECSPCLEIKDGNLKLTFIGGIFELSKGMGPKYQMYEMVGTDITQLSSAYPISDLTIFAGFRRSDITVYSLGNNEIILIDNAGNEEKITTMFGRIVRLSWLDSNPKQIIITGMYDPTTTASHILDLETREISEILAKGESVYKCSIHKNKLYHAIRDIPVLIPLSLDAPSGDIQETNQGFENRNIVEEKDFDIVLMSNSNKPEVMPMMSQRVENFIKAVDQHLQTGSQKVDKNLQEHRLKICEQCEFRTPEWVCSHQDCGCFLTIKTEWADQKCPINKWDKINLPLTEEKSNWVEVKRSCCN